MATEQLMVRLSMQAQQYKREAREAASATGRISGQATAAGKATGGLQTKMAGFGSVLKGAAVTGGILALGRGIGNAIERAEEMSSAYAVTEQVIRQTGGAANLTTEDIKKLSREQSLLTGVDKAMVTEGNNVLLTFKNIREEVGEGNNVFERTSDLMLDVATVMNSDAKGAAIQLGKALNDPVANMGALSRSGLTFNQQQKDQIKTLAESGQLLEAQKIILSELETQLGGTAAASADASDKVSNAFKEISESIGAGMLPVLEDVSIELQTIVGLSDELDRVAGHAGGAAESAAAFLTVISEETGGAGFISGVGSAIEEFASFINPAISRTERFRDKLTELAERLELTELQSARDGIDTLGESMGLTASEIEIVRDVLDEAIGNVEHVARASGSSAGEIDTLTGSVGDLTGELNESDTSWRDVISSMENYEDMLRRLTDPVFKAIDDQRRLEEATQKYLDVIEDPEATVGEQEQAMWDLVGAQLAAEESAAGLPDDMKASTDSIILLGDRAGIAEGDLSRLREMIDSFDGRVARAEIEVAVRRTGAPIDPNTIIGAELGRQHGGPVRAGDPYVVGEDGPELFIPGQSGMVVSNSQTATSGTSVGSSGPTFVFYGDVYGDEGFMRKVREANVQNARLGR